MYAETDESAAPGGDSRRDSARAGAQPGAAAPAVCARPASTSRRRRCRATSASSAWSKGAPTAPTRRPGAPAAPNGKAAESMLQRAVAEYLLRVDRVQQLVLLRTGLGQRAGALRDDRRCAAAGGGRDRGRRRHRAGDCAGREARQGAREAVRTIHRRGTDGVKPRIVFACSGSAENLAAIPWLSTAFDAEIVALTLDVGQARDVSKACARRHSRPVPCVRTSSMPAKSSPATASLPSLDGRRRPRVHRRPCAGASAHRDESSIEIAHIEGAQRDRARRRPGRPDRD